MNPTACATCTPLRRSVWSVCNGPLSFLGVVLLPLFVVLSIDDPIGLAFLVPTLIAAAWPLGRPLRLCGDALVVPRFMLGEFRLPIEQIEVIEVRRVRWSGIPGYNGFAMLLVTPGGERIVGQSLYCGRDRLDRWAATIAVSHAFFGEVRSTPLSRRFEGGHRWPAL